MAETELPCRTYGSDAARPFLGRSSWPTRTTPGGVATSCPADLGPAPLAGAGDRGTAGHAEDRRDGVGCGFRLGVGNDDGPEEAHGAGAVDERAPAGDGQGIPRVAGPVGRPRRRLMPCSRTAAATMTSTAVLCGLSASHR